MKNKFASLFLVAVALLTLASCATSRKYGCPSAYVQKVSHKS